MRVWIDLANSPHVPFFAPILDRLRLRGHTVVLTAREFAQTLPLARARGWSVQTIGGHGGTNLARKALNISGRAMALRRFGALARADVAVSHNSYAHGLASKLLGLPYATIMDYEHTPANHVSFRLADLVIVPRLIDPVSIARFGARPRKMMRYDGIKEQLYLSGFVPDPSFDETEAGRMIDPGRVLVVARPPADFAVYHRFDNPLFEGVVRALAADSKAQILLLPRTAAQRRMVEGWRLPGCSILPESTDGASLIARADLVVSAGGTMNREAAVLGTPAWTVFKGKMGAVDRWLAEIGRLEVLRDVSDLGRLELRKKVPGAALESPGLLDQVVSAIERLESRD